MVKCNLSHNKVSPSVKRVISGGILIHCMKGEKTQKHSAKQALLKNIYYLCIRFILTNMKRL